MTPNVPVTIDVEAWAETFRALCGPHVSFRRIQVQVDFAHHRALNDAEHEALAERLRALSSGVPVYVLSERGVSAGLRRITLQIGGIPPR